MPIAYPPYQRAHDEDAAWRGSDRRQAAAAWWKAALTDLPEVTGPVPGRANSGHDFIRKTRWLPDDLANLLEVYSETHKLSWPDVLNALTGAYLARWTGNEAVIGLPFMARIGRKIARLPCMAMNVLPHRIHPDEGAPLPDWLRDQAALMREARKYGLYRSEYLRRDLGLIGGSRRLYGPLVNVQPFDRPPVFPGLQVGLHILGAGAVIAWNHHLFLGLRVVGALYLIWIGLRILTAPAIPKASIIKGQPFLVGLLTALTNPFAIAFWFGTFLAAVPASAPDHFYARIFGLIILQSLIWYSSLAILFSTAMRGRTLGTARLMRYVTAGALILIGTSAMVLG